MHHIKFRNQFFARLVAMAALAMASMTLRADDKGSEHKDAAFIREVAKGGKMEVQMGQLGVDRGQSADIKRLGERIVKDHTKANEELARLVAQKGVDLVADAEKHPHHKMPDDLSKKSGAEFDKEFAKHMVKHHKKNIAKFEKASRSSQDAEVRNFIDKTLPTLRAHLTEAQAAARVVGVDEKTLSSFDVELDGERGKGAAPSVEIERSKSGHTPDASRNYEPTRPAQPESKPDASASVNIDTDKNDGKTLGIETRKEDGKVLGVETQPNDGKTLGVETRKEDGKVLGVETQPNDGRTLGVETRQEDGKTLGVETRKGDGKILGLSTDKNDGKLLGILPAPKKKNSAEVTVQTENSSSTDPNVNRVDAGAPPGPVLEADTSVNTDGSLKAKQLTFTEVPKAVQDTIKAEGGTSDVKGIKRETKDGRTVYQVDFKREGRNVILHIGEDGSIVKDNRRK